MAISSILHQVHIEGGAAALSFLEAVESSERAAAKRKPLRVSIKELKTEEQISALLAKYKGQK